MVWNINFWEYEHQSIFHTSTAALQKVCLWFAQCVFFSSNLLQYNGNYFQNKLCTEYRKVLVWGRLRSLELRAFYLWEKINLAKQSHSMINLAKQSHSMINRILFCITGFDARDKNIHIKNPKRCTSVSKFYSIFIWSSTCFERHTAHHQEPKTAHAASGIEYTLSDSVQQPHVQQPSTYVKPEAACAVLGSWWWAVCRPKHVELHINMK